MSEIPTLEDGAVCWVHIGDTHLVDRDAPNFRHLAAIAREAQALFSDGADFVYLPGDVAEHGAPAQYALAREALRPLKLPLFAVPGDHDMHPRRLDSFREAFPRPLPAVHAVGGWRCLFLDMVGQGAGGPDFRLGAEQFDWLEQRLAAADKGDGAILFLHAYPADLADETERRAVVELIRRHNVVAVDMGHTHYNELANDGRTVFAATRSVGQIEEGPPGLSVSAVDGGGALSWRFRPLDACGPLALIASPADRRLVAEARGPRQGLRPGDPLEVRALAFPVGRVAGLRFRIGDGPWRPMQRRSARMWAGEATTPDRVFRLTVEAMDADGATDSDVIEVAPASVSVPPPRAGVGSDADAIGAWPEKHIHGGQLGPNRNGRKW